MSGTEPTPRPRPLESAKITDTHRSELAVVYVRQPNPQQVVENRESLDRQYALADHARRVGSRKHLVIWADAEERDRLRRLRDAFRPGQASGYPAELTRPKARPDQSS